MFLFTIICSTRCHGTRHFVNKNVIWVPTSNKVFSPSLNFNELRTLKEIEKTLFTSE